ncbi:MAG: 16S rRNA (uracil(1498)-N(3))-methyltransferase [Elusimicrobia bacterium]|nr:16S rRNA (uracil(1498)-N(3))-methyltransferase [Elusimicrobiota bacterium]
MPRRFDPFFRKKHKRPDSGPRSGEASGRSDALGDAPLELPSLKLGEPFKFDAAFARRLTRRDVNPKEAFTVRDAAGAYFRASLKESGPEGGTAVPYEACALSPEPGVEITLACAVLGRQRMLFVAQKATELGVARIVPLFTEFSVQARDLAHEKAHAWPGQVVRAAKQCRRSSLPEIRPPMTLDAFLASPLADADLRLCLDNVGGESPAPASAPRRIMLLIGPEGGFSDAERAKLSGKTVSWELGGRVLRAETAVLVGLSAVQLKWGDFRS